jgi:hypothetical protein
MTTGATPQDATHVHDTEEGRIYYRCLPPQAPGAGVKWDKWDGGAWVVVESAPWAWLRHLGVR